MAERIHRMKFQKQINNSLRLRMCNLLSVRNLQSSVKYKFYLYRVFLGIYTVEFD